MGEHMFAHAEDGQVVGDRGVFRKRIPTTCAEAGSGAALALSLG
jgi:hypothetical protein